MYKIEANVNELRATKTNDDILYSISFKSNKDAQTGEDTFLSMDINIKRNVDNKLVSCGNYVKRNNGQNSLSLNNTVDLSTKVIIQANVNQIESDCIGLLTGNTLPTE